jgi:hypothetical protein
MYCVLCNVPVTCMAVLFADLRIWCFCILAQWLFWLGEMSFIRWTEKHCLARWYICTYVKRDICYCFSTCGAYKLILDPNWTWAHIWNNLYQTIICQEYYVKFLLVKIKLCNWMCCVVNTWIITKLLIVHDSAESRCTVVTVLFSPSRIRSWRLPG